MTSPSADESAKRRELTDWCYPAAGAVVVVTATGADVVVTAAGDEVVVTAAGTDVVVEPTEAEPVVRAWSWYTWLSRSHVITEPLTDVALSETIWPGSWKETLISIPICAMSARVIPRDSVVFDLPDSRVIRSVIPGTFTFASSAHWLAFCVIENDENRPVLVPPWAISAASNAPREWKVHRTCMPSQPSESV